MTSRRQWLQFGSLGVIAAMIPPLLAATQAKRLLFVHGRGQQAQDPAVLKAQWLDTLKLGAQAAGVTFPAGIDVAFPYYGDLLESYTSRSEIPLTSDIQARGGAVDNEFLVFQAQIAEELRQRAGVTDAQVDAEYGANSRPRGPLNWEWVQAILRAIDKYGGGVNQQTLEVFTRDVYLYTTRAGVRDDINRVVATQLTEEPTVVVAHSLGTVVAYSILRSDLRRLRIPLLVTVGSPLGVRAIRDQLRPLRFPSPVDGWYNAFDARDVVALYPLDAGNFPVQPSVENNGTVKNHTDNRHGIVGYLDDATVAKRILGTLNAGTI